MKFLKGKFKRVIAGALSLLMLAGVMPTTVFAADNTISMSFGPAYQSDGSLICYQDSFTSPNGLTDGSPGGTQRRVIIYGDGEEAFCIQPGVPLNTGDQLTANASEAWNALSSTQRAAIKLALAYGKPGNSSGLSGSGDAKYIATQMVVWELVNGWRNTSSYERTNNSVYNALCKGGANSEVATVYKQIVSGMQNHKITPSFATGKTYDMDFADGQYTLTLKDSNKVLSDYKISCSDENVKIVRDGNQLTISSKVVLDKDVKVTVTKSSKISSSAKLVAYGSATRQDTIIGVERPDDVSATFKISTPAGNMELVKTSEDGIVEGIQMIISGNGFNETVTTGKGGKITLEGLYPETYTVTERAADYYEPQEAKKVTIKAGETSTVTFNNVLKRGDVTVSKTSEDGFNEGLKFRLYGISASGLEVNEYATTDETGVATFKNVLIAGAAGYTLEEVDTAVRYVIPDDQNVKVNWKEVTNTSVQNTLKKFNVTVNKVDAEMTVSQGDATLAGAVYGLYKDGELVESMTTDEKGSFTTGYHVCGDDWTIREITPSEGYLLDETVYKVGAEAKNYNVEFNSAPAIESKEQVIKGQISIIKHTDDGSTQIETPEEGATFEVYLTAAGSYENAKETERDLLVCDADGYAITKELPYGKYTVHQTAGAEETEFMKDFTVFVSQEGQVYKYLINNAPYSAYIKVVKADKETGKTIALSGAGFEIYNAEGQKVTMSYTYPTVTTIDTYYVSDDGYLITPQVLPAGDYTLVEVQAPYGYVLDTTPIPFTVTMADNTEENAGDDKINVITVTAYDMAQKGKITIFKTGEVFSTVTVSGDEVLNKDGYTSLINCVYQPVYEEKGLLGATYQVIAVEDVVTGDGTIRYKAGDVVDEVTTGEDGSATTDELYLGHYQVVEVVAPDGYVLNATPTDVELVYAGQEVSVVDAATGFNNDRQKLRIKAMKFLEQDETFGIGMNGEIKSVSFGLYAKEEIIAADGSVIPADGLIEIAFCAEDGSVVFQSDVPFGKYYVKEYAADDHYLMSGTAYVFEFAYAGQEISTVKVALKDGEAIENTLKRGKIEGYKVDGEDKGLSGATFGLFDEWTKEYTAENAYMTIVSDEKGYFAFENVPVGDYVVVELEAPEGYVRADARHFVAVTYDTQVIGLKAINYLIVGSVQLTKVDEEYPDNKLAGAVFEVFADTNKDSVFTAEKDECLGTLTEVNEGVYEMEGLLYGDYFVKEKTAPKGFLLDENVYPFSIVNDKEVVVVENEAGVGFKNQPIKGDITIFKTDEVTGDKLVGAGFHVFDANGEVAAEGYTGEDGTVTFELRYGEYTVAEFAAPEGYVLDDAPYAFIVKEHGQKISVDMANTKIKGKLVLSKVDAETEALLPDAGFRIYDVNDEVIREGVTDKKGNVEFELEFGTYYYQEYEAPEGYVVDDTKYEFTITENGQIFSVIMTNSKITGKLVLSKVDAETEELLPGAGFRIYDEDGEVIREGVTDDKGNVEFDLEYGTYYYQEFDAPDGYEVDDTKYEFSITEDGQVVSVVMKNKKLPVETPKEEPKEETPTKPSVSTDSPKTGDDADVALWAVFAAVAALAGAGLSIASIVSKNRKKGK